MKKMKKWSIIMATGMALLLLALAPISALAQSDTDAAGNSKPKLKGALAIVAPWMAPVGKEISMTVFLRENQEPFGGAGIWALDRKSVV
jgi:hypothetical protein